MAITSPEVTASETLSRTSLPESPPKVTVTFFASQMGVPLVGGRGGGHLANLIVGRQKAKSE